MWVYRELHSRAVLLSDSTQPKYGIQEEKRHTTSATGFYSSFVPPRCVWQHEAEQN